MTKFIIEQLRKENAFLNDMLENAHNRSRLLEEQLQQAQTKLASYKAGMEVGGQVIAHKLYVPGHSIAFENQRVRVLVMKEEGV